MKQSRLQKVDNRNGERGSVIAITAIAMLALLVAAGLAIDISHLYTAKAELQNAADAAALAGASQLNSTTGGIRLAVAEATKVLNKYDFSSDVSIPAANITFGTNLNGAYVSQASAEASAATIRFVQVAIPPKPVNITFAALAMSNPQNLTATATAGTSVGLTMNKFYTAYTFIESAAAPLVPGQVYTLNPKTWNDSSPTSYRVLSYQGGDLVLTGSIHAYGYIGSSYTIARLNGTSPAGNLTAPSMCRYAQIGMNTRFGDYTVHPQANPIDEPPDTITQENITYQQYRDMQGNGVVQSSGGMRNRRMMQVPIAVNNTYDTSGGAVNADRLAAFFVRKKVDATCGLQVEYVGGPIAVPDGTFQPGLSQMGGLSIPVLYK